MFEICENIFSFFFFFATIEEIESKISRERFHLSSYE